MSGNLIIKAGTATGGMTNTGGSFTIRAGTATGCGTNTGGDLIIRPGPGYPTLPKNFIDKNIPTIFWNSNGRTAYVSMRT